MFSVIALTALSAFGLAAIGKPFRALAWFVAALAGGLLSLLVSPWLVVVCAACLIGAMIDTAVHARRKATLSLIAPWLALVLAIAVVTPLVLSTGAAAQLFRIPSQSMVPTLDVGDHFMMDKLTYRFRSPERGEVIVFSYPCDPTRDNVKRVVGLPGDTVELRCQQLYVNGSAAPTELVPGECSWQEVPFEDGAPWQTHACSRYRETVGDHTYEVFHDPEPAHDARSEFPLAGKSAPRCSGSEAKPDSGEIVPGATTSDACAPQLHFVVPPNEVFVLGDNRPNSNDSRYWGGVPLTAIKGRASGIWWPGLHSRGIGAIR